MHATMNGQASLLSAVKKRGIEVSEKSRRLFSSLSFGSSMDEEDRQNVSKMKPKKCKHAAI